MKLKRYEANTIKSVIGQTTGKIKDLRIAKDIYDKFNEGIGTPPEPPVPAEGKPVDESLISEYKKTVEKFWETEFDVDLVDNQILFIKDKLSNLNAFSCEPESVERMVMMADKFGL